MKNLKFIKIIAVFFVLLSVMSYIYYDKTRQIAVENAQVKIDELLLNYKAFRAYIGKVQKPEVYRLQQDKQIECTYFMPQLLSSTYGAKTVNEFYNIFRERNQQSPIKIRFASDNPRNLNNKASQKESEILKKFNDGKISKYTEVVESIDGKKLYLAVPTQRTTDKCMKCHSDPKIAPQQMVKIYGDKNGFYEKEGQIRALLSTVYPLEDDLAYANDIFFRLMAVTIIVFTIILFVVYKFTQKINNKNEELELLNESLDKKVEQRTKELDYERKYIESIFDLTPSIIIVTDGEKLINANQKTFDYLGFKNIEEFKKKHNCICDFISKLDNKVLDENKKVDNENWCAYLMKHNHVPHHIEITRNNKKYYFIVEANHLNEEDIIITFNDITELKDKDQLLFEQTKLASMGEMIGNIAHQWRQPLSIISTSATGLKVQKEYGLLSDSELVRLCDLIDDNAQYLSNTIDDFRNYIKGDRKKVEFSLKENIEHLLHLVEPSSKNHNIKIVTDIKDDYTLYGYKNEITQCFMNIFSNAKDALKENVEDSSRVFFISAVKKNNNIVVSFKDNAGGIPDDVLPKIFEPYFTTKHKAQGTGLGLHMTYSLIVDGMHGNIKVSNENFAYENKKFTGAMFKIILPLDYNMEDK